MNLSFLDRLFARPAPRTVRIRRGFDIAVAGAPRQEVTEAPTISEIGVLAADYPGFRIDMRVRPGDTVAAGDVLFVDRRRPDIAVTAPAAGTIAAVIERDPRAAGRACVIRLGGDKAKPFEAPGTAPDRARARALLLESGLWSALVSRPFGRVPDPGAVPAAIFVTAIDTNPLAADPLVVIAGQEEDFRAGLQVLKTLTDGPVHLCQGPGRRLAEDAVVFAGPHPAGLAGTHIHHLHRGGAGWPVWHLDYQDTLAIGRLFTTGTLGCERVVALAGPAVRDPRLVRARLGAALGELTRGQLHDGDVRVVSGSLLTGREAPYLGRRHLQVAALFEGGGPHPGRSWFAVTDTGRNGASGPVIPTAALARALASDIPALPLARALMVGDGDTARRLGCRELIEEDVALMSYACPGKGDYAAALRAVLDDIEAGP